MKKMRMGFTAGLLLLQGVVLNSADASQLDATFSTNRLDLHWGSAPGQVQQVQVSSDLVNWSNLPPLMASVFNNSAWSDDGSLTGVAPNSRPQRYYRLLMLPQTLNQLVGVPATFLPPSAGNSYSWDFGDGTISTSASPTHTYQFDGIYTVRASVTDASGTHFTTNTVQAEVPSRILLTPTVLASLRQKAATNSTQWQSFKSRLDGQLNVVIESGAAYQGDELSWIGDYALGYKVLQFKDPTTANKYADKAIALLHSALQNLFPGTHRARKRRSFFNGVSDGLFQINIFTRAHSVHTD